MEVSIDGKAALSAQVVADPCKDNEVVVRSDFLDHADAGEEAKGNEDGGCDPDSYSDGEHGGSSVLQSFGGVRHGLPMTTTSVAVVLTR